MREGALLLLLALVMTSGATSRSSSAQASAGVLDGLRVLAFEVFPGTLTPARIFIPVGLSSVRELVVFLHGDNIPLAGVAGAPPRPQTLPEIIERHNLRPQIQKASQGRRAASAWVVPFSRGKCEDFNATFSDPTRTADFFRGVAKALRDAGVSVPDAPRLVLAGQSRARNPLSKLLKLRKAAELFLFDALHNTTPELIAAANRPDVRAWIVYSSATQKGTKAFFDALRPGSRELFKDAQISAKILTPAPDTQAYLDGAPLGACFSFNEQDKAAALGFVSSSVEHRFTTRAYLAAVMS